MSFQGITFDNQNVSPKNDGGLYGGFLGDGILWGCGMNISGDNLVVYSGEIIVGGRVVLVNGATEVDLSERQLSTGYIQVILNADISQGEGMQVYPSFVEQATATFPSLTYGNINDTDTLRQFELAVVQISGGNLTSIYRTALQARILFDDPSGRRGVFGFFTPNLYAYTYDPTDGSPLAGMRTSDTDNAVIFAPNKSILIRPQGADESNGQTVFNADGMINGGGVVSSMSDVVERQGTTFMIHSYLSTTTSCPNNSWTTIRTINDAKFRPPQTAYGLALGFGNQKTMSFVQVTTSGAIQVQPWVSTTGTQSWITYVTWINQSWTP